MVAGARVADVLEEKKPVGMEAFLKGSRSQPSIHLTGISERMPGRAR